MSTNQDSFSAHKLIIDGPVTIQIDQPDRNESTVVLHIVNSEGQTIHELTIKADGIDIEPI